VKRLLSYLFILIIFTSIESTVFGNKAPTKILFLGDSLTAGYGVSKKMAFPALIEKQFNKKSPGRVRVFNGGISGSTTAGGVARLKWYLKRKPDILVLALGANDGLRGVNLNASKKNLSLVILKAKELKIKILLAGMLLPLNYGKNYRGRFKKMFIELAREHQLKLVPFLLKGVGGEPKFNIEDGIHPNEEGHKIITKTLTPYLEDLL
jgi:acyl-CoA thioesterase I